MSKNKQLSLELDKLKEENRLKNDIIDELKKKIRLFEKSKRNERNSVCSYSAVLCGKKNEEPEVVMLSLVTKELSEQNRIDSNVVISEIKEIGANEAVKYENDIAKVIKVLDENG